MRTPSPAIRRQAQSLLRIQMCDVGIAAILLDHEDASAIAAQRQYTIVLAASA